MRGYFGIGIYNIKNAVNIGTLWRSAFTFGASYLFTIGSRYRKQASDTTKTWRHIPLFHYENFEDLQIPFNCQLIGIELGGDSLCTFQHPERAIYLLGAEDYGLPNNILKNCHFTLEIPSVKPYCLNVSVAGSIVMFDRFMKSLLLEHTN